VLSTFTDAVLASSSLSSLDPAIYDTPTVHRFGRSVAFIRL